MLVRGMSNGDRIMLVWRDWTLVLLVYRNLSQCMFENGMTI